MVTLQAALSEHGQAFGLDLSPPEVEKLQHYYELILLHNPILHLVAPMSAEEFAIRHLLESLSILQFLPDRSRVADVGAGAGLPLIPCLIRRASLQGSLVESKPKKANFLVHAVEELGLASRVEVVNKQFQEWDPAAATHITCRALDKFVENIPRLLRWAGRRDLLLFGGNSLGEALVKNHVEFTRNLMPLSEQRFLFVCNRSV